MHDNISYGTLEVKVGTEVIWTSRCFSLCTITFRTGGVDSGLMKTGDTFKHTFDVPGSYQYYCQFDPAEMIGTIIVTK
jgi:plastocyanin